MFVYYAIVLLLGWLILLLWPTRVINKKNRPKRKKGAVICCNHHTLFDPVIVGMHIPRRLRFVAKKEITKSLPGRFIIWSTGSFAVDRGQPNVGTLKKMIAVLKKGKVILLFPEGTRNRGDEGSLQELHNGAILLAVKARVPIVPMAMLRRPRVFRRNYFVYGEPLEYAELYEQKLTKEKLETATRLLAERMEELQRAEPRFPNKIIERK